MLNQNGPITADTVYSDGTLVAQNVAFTLPALAFMTADYRAMGTISLPITGMLESMETSISKIGVDRGLVRMMRIGSMTLEFRWVQNALRPDGTTVEEGCKAFVRCVPKSIPGISIDPGSTVQSDLTFEVLRYQLYVGAHEYALIDRLNQICRIDGVDYYKSIASML